MTILPLGIAMVAAAIWLVLLIGRGFFWLAAETDEAFAGAPATWPSVIAVIPARDEADMIDTTVASLLGQDYPGPFHVVVVDDASSDATSAVARAAAAGSPRPQGLTVIAGRPLESGWTGKLFALQQGVEHVEALPHPAEFLLFTDADIVHAPTSVRSLVARATADRLVMVSLMAKLRCVSLAERALVPAFIFFFAMLYPFRRVNDPRSGTAAAAGGCVLADRRALHAAGGLEAVRGELIDDCALGKIMKTQGAIRLSLTRRVESRRVYDSFDAVRRMVVRSAYAQLRYSPVLLAGTVGGLVVTYLAAPALAVGGHGSARIIGIAVWAAMALAFQPTLAFYRRSPLWGLALPLIAAVYALFTLDSARLFYAGRGGQWKGRTQAPSQGSVRTRRNTEARAAALPGSQAP